MTTVCSYNTIQHSVFMSYSTSRHANSAGLALPHIPRRTSHTRTPALSTQTFHATLELSKPTAAKVVVEPPTPPDARATQLPVASTSGHSSGSGSGSDGHLEFKARRQRIHQRGSIPSMRPPEQSTPTPAVFSAKRIPFPMQDDTPKARIFAPTPRPGIRPLTTLNPKAEDFPSRSMSVNISSLVRKKSGEPLKSSLKSRRPVVRGDLSVVTGPISTKSEPSTPTHIKSVHFDAKLEHVKLFLAEQKPAAVSRDGSPTDDTSGTESDFPAFIYGDSAEKKGKLQIEVEGLKEEEKEPAEAKLEAMELSEDGTSVVGRVRVRNIAFEKWVAVRFTFDLWQTTSEVTARYLDSLPGGADDRFQFTIRLTDMMTRIEEKKMFLAIRYSAAGREIWDNNHGQNYRVTFSRQKVSRILPKSAIDEAGKASGIADLKSKLEKVASGDEGPSTVGGFLASRATRTRSLSPTGPTPDSLSLQGHDAGDGFTLRSNKPLSSRYDFAASLENPWRRSSAIETTPTSADDHSRLNTYPNSLPHFPRRATSDKRTFIALTRGSPRIFEGEDVDARSPVHPYYANSELEDTPIPAMGRKARNHQRGYFDLGVTPTANGVRRTPPGSPFDGPALSPSGSGRTSPAEAGSSLPVIETTNEYGVGQVLGMWRVPSGGSEDSTPSSTSNEDSSRSSSPDGSPFEGPISLAPEDGFPRSPSPDDKHSYSAFLNRFCFYTGSDSMLDVPSELHRSHSASSVEELLSSSPYLGVDYRIASQTPTRSSSYDDVATISGSTTPTARSVAAGASTGVFASPVVPTAVAFVH
ncbi:carbohydrate-binding module family 21 protein [Phlebiopsis gigantea 11061_1 CR5-6]|uniref:Carbohydrate-binding module family 21 protein n=1 Tax=Phlebiopsis gigantea (strain 11061_1 CR5-6) TaxID=745531 RepID=A0A0C3S272_PHLG1|nr:carbohydrate-binding module family 21 protein [Phlebiopsis gigantea 11061_1 CR5-6]